MKLTRRPALVLLAVATLAGLGAAWAVARTLERRESARRALACAQNLRQVGVALGAYAEHHDGFPPGTLPDPSLPPDRRLSWLAAIVEYLYITNLAQSLRWDRPWDDPENRSLITTTPPDCPHAAHADGQGLTSYVGIAGLGPDAPTLPAGHRRAGVFGYERQTRPGEIADGASSTMMVVETARENGPWLAGGPATLRGVDPARRPYIGPGRPFGGNRHRGANVLFADGSVRPVRESLDPRVFEAQATIAGGERIPDGRGE